MINMDKFYQDITLFSNSLVIKINDVASVMETAYIMPLLLNKFSRTKFRYYTHLKGEYYTTPPEYKYNPPFKDSYVYIKVIETEESQILTKDLLEKYPVTKEELLKQGDYYQDLISSYPRMVTFIHGCLFPTSYTIEELIDLPDGTIIGYNSKFLEEQEYSLIKNLQEFIINFLSRWNVQDYIITDNLYLHSLLGVLYGHLPNKIVNLRLDKIRTHEVHSFFLESYFRSKFDIWDNIKSLKKETITWLYLNLDYLIKHLGSNKVFNLLLKEVFSKNNIGIGGYVIQLEDVKLNPNHIYNLKESPFSKTKALVEKRGLNDKYIYNDLDTVSITSTLKKEFSLLNKYPTDQESYLIDVYDKQINKQVKGLNKTKVLEISTLKTFNGHNIDSLQVLIDYWGYLLSKDLYGSFNKDDVVAAKIEYTDPNTQMHYNLTSRSGYYLLLYLILHSSNAVEIPLTDMIISTVLDPKAKVNDILTQHLFQDGYTQFYSKYLIDNYPKPSRVFTSYLDVSRFLEEVILYYKNIWLYSSNSENTIVSANLKEFLFLCSLQEKIKIHKESKPTNILTLLRQENINFQIQPDSNYDHITAIKALLKSCLGVTIDNITALKKMLQNYQELINKLTSYTLQVFGDVEDQDTNYVFYNTNNLFLSQKGLINLHSNAIEIQPLSKIDHKVQFLATTASDSLTTWEYNMNQNSQLLDNIPLGGIAIGYSDEMIAGCYSSASIDFMSIRNDVKPNIYPNYNQDLLFIRKVDKINDQSSHQVAFYPHHDVDLVTVGSPSNDSRIEDKDQIIKGTARVKFDDDPTPRDTTSIDKK